VLLAQRSDLAACRQDYKVSVTSHLSHALEEKARLDRPATIANDDRQCGVVLDDLSVDKPVAVVVINDLDVYRDVLPQEEALDDVGHHRRASHTIEGNRLEMSGLDPAPQAAVQSV